MLRYISLTVTRSSLSHGTPPNISSRNYDVALPKEPLSTTSDTETPSTYPHLSSLTQVLGEILPIIYTLRPNEQDVWKVIRRTECSLDDWADNLPVSLKAARHAIGQQAVVFGSSSLWFCYLSVKLVLNRLAFKVSLPGKVLLRVRYCSF